MKVIDLIKQLSDFDPDCKVEVGTTTSNWCWDGEHSVEVESFSFTTIFHCWQKENGTIVLANSDEALSEGLRRKIEIEKGD